MEQRPALILKLLTEEYIETATPVASQTLVEKYNLDFSPATVRNDLAELEERGYIKQPHTSAGRIPTELAYRYLINQLNKGTPSRKTQTMLKPYFNDLNSNWKQLAKTLAQLTGNGIFWSFHRYDSYYTGLSGLLSQPEFKQLPLVYDISQVIDSLEEIINDLFDKIPEKPIIRLGSDSPFGPFSSTILTKYRYGEHLGLFGLLAPLRNNYQENFNLINYVYDHIQEKDNKEAKNEQNESVKTVKLGEYQELESKYKRALADQQNLVKQHQKDRSHYIKYANEQLLLTILPIYDNLKLAYKHFNLDNPSSWLDGLKYIIKQFKDTLEQEGVTEIETHNQLFDHHSMEAVEIIKTNNKEQDNIVAEEVRSGYKLADRIIIPARVKVYHYEDHQNGSMPLDHN